MRFHVALSERFSDVYDVTRRKKYVHIIRYFVTHNIVLRLLHSKEKRRLEALRADTKCWNSHRLVQK